MSTSDVPSAAAADAGPDPVQDALSRFGSHWGSMLTLGIIMFILGVLALAIPGATMFALTFIVAIQLFVLGIYQIVQAFRADDASAGMRTLYALTGALSLLVGMLVLRDPLQTLFIIAVLLGAWWVVTGVVEVVTSISRGSQPDRWWRLAMGVISVVAGFVVLAEPGMSLRVLEILLAVWLMVYGIMAAVAAFSVRSYARHHVAATPPPSAEGLAPA
jgi:uncharacterized membrane protein HdeD (DUF308 family)